MFGIPVRHPEAAPAVSGILRVLGRTAGEHSAAAGRVEGYRIRLSTRVRRSEA